MVLFNAGVRAVFESHLERMPTDIEARWRDLIAGGARSEAFGPLTLQERLDERQVETALVAGRRQRIVNLFVTLVLIVGVVVGASGIEPVTTDLGYEVESQAWGHGLTFRAGIEFGLRSGSTMGLSFRTLDGEIDFGPAGLSEFDAWQVLFTASRSF